MTIFEALTWANKELKESQLPPPFTQHNPKVDAQVLLAACLDKPTSYLFAHGDEVVQTEVYDRFYKLIRRRVAHEPVALLLGEKEFYRLAFKVTKDTLVPRPETELMVDLALKEARPGTLFVDLGTGSGAIAIALAKNSNCPVVAIDASAQALNIAYENAVTHGVQRKIAFLEGNLFKPYTETMQRELSKKPDALVICANLPYLTLNQWEALDPDVKLFEPKSALVGGVDGLELYDELFMQLKARRKELPKGIKLFLEIDPKQRTSAPALVKHYFADTLPEIVLDFFGRERFVVVIL